MQLDKDFLNRGEDFGILNRNESSLSQARQEEMVSQPRPISSKQSRLTPWEKTQWGKGE